MAALDLSIVLPVYDDQKNLDRILDELSANSPEGKWEVIIVDDGSPKPLMLRPTLPDHFKIHRSETRRGAAGARNAGVKQARGEFVVLLSVFLKLPEDYISRIRVFIKRYDFDFAQHVLKKAPNISANHFQDFVANHGDRVSQKTKKVPIKQSLFTAAIIAKETFCRVKGFDESMQHYGGHEMDLIYRLDQTGIHNRMTIPDFPLERMKLENHSTIRQRLQEYGQTGLPALLKKHPELKRTILTHPLLWSLLKVIDLPKSMERQFKRRIEQDIELSKRQYRLYLHLIVRNAWDAR